MALYKGTHTSKSLGKSFCEIQRHNYAADTWYKK